MNVKLKVLTAGVLFFTGQALVAQEVKKDTTSGKEKIIDETLPEKGIPSTTYKGSLFPLTEPNPLILTVGSLPGCPELLITLTPADSPANACETVETFLFSIDFIFTLAAVPT